MIFRAAPALLLATCALLGAGCKKEQESLVLANLRLATDPGPAALTSVKLEAAGRQATFTVPMLSAGMVTQLGLYLPGSATGPITVVATAYPLNGCAGFRGMSDTTIASAGVTQSVAITMDAFDVCPADGGSAGTGGSSGTGGGAAGTGGTGGGSAGTTGTAGTGGSAGTTGTAGTGGSAGTTGTAGTGGGAGRGGTGGGGAGGTTGTGGAAGYPSISACRPFPHGATSCPNNYVNSVAISPNGQLVATGGDSFDGRVKIWNFDGRTLTPTSTVLTGFNGYTVAFSPDGLRLAYTSNPDINTAVIRTYSVPTFIAGPTLQDNGSGSTLVGVEFTPDSLRVVSANAIGTAGGDVFVHTLAAGGTAPTYTAHIPNEPYGMAVLGPKAPNNGTVAVAVGSYYGSVTVLSLTSTGFTTTAVTLPASGTGETTQTVEFSPDGSLLATGEGNGPVRFWINPPGTAPIGPAISFPAGDVYDIAFSPNGMYLAVGGGFANKRLSIYSVATHAEVAYTVPAAGDVVSLVFSPNGGAIIAGLDGCATVLVCN